MAENLTGALQACCFSRADEMYWLFGAGMSASRLTADKCRADTCLSSLLGAILLNGLVFLGR
jgi:hypothetical protein